MTPTLKRLEEKFGLHNLGSQKAPLPGPDGCILFVIDRRCVVDGPLELRVAVSFGDNPFPLSRGQCAMCPAPMDGKHCFLIHMIGTEGRYLRVFDMCHDGRPANDSMITAAAAERAKEILASISDDDYVRAVGDAHGLHFPPVALIEPLPLDEYEFLHDSESLPAK